jgi:hypothetical protein
MADPPPAGRRHLAGTWTGLVGAPLVWLGYLQASYALVQWACREQSPLALHLVGLIALAAVAAAGWLSWQAQGADGGGAPSRAASRRRFLGAIGVWSSALFALVIAVSELAVWVLEPCRP